MDEDRHLTSVELEAGLDEVRRSPRDRGTLALIVRRPRVDERETLAFAELDEHQGLVGDRWLPRGEDYDRQLTLMNIRAAELVATGRERAPLAGDQLYVDFDLSEDNAPPGTRLAIGAAVVEITAPPHTGCGKFTSRFGRAAMEFVNSPLGKHLHLRGVNARVVQGGVIRAGDEVARIGG
jgi:MOSC domain-containing protein YiiM